MLFVQLRIAEQHLVCVIQMKCVFVCIFVEVFCDSKGTSKRLNYCFGVQWQQMLKIFKIRFFVPSRCIMLLYFTI
jgi:hypothetical protein